MTTVGDGAGNRRLMRSRVGGRKVRAPQSKALANGQGRENGNHVIAFSRYGQCNRE